MICKLCLCDKDLKNSHIIPNAFIRRIKENGLATHVTSDINEPVRNSIESYHEKMLCGNCEQLLSREYERYSIRFLKGGAKGVKFIHHSDKVKVLGADLRRIYLFVLSVFWRAAMSNERIFNEKVFFPDYLLEEFRKCILLGKVNHSSVYILKISRLVCNHDFPNMTGEKFVRDLVMLPFHRINDNEASFHWIALGFVFSFSVSSSQLKPIGSTILRGHGSKVSAVYVELRNIPEIIAILDTIHKREIPS
ncbi:hypothetical protein MRB56_02405 [Halomonas cupida]|uniref:hypothetical protein n=1 Tax=Halomonas cupida TaxID=44933 RepID=UPI0039B4DF0A